MTSRHRTFLLTWNPDSEEGNPKDFDVEIGITQEEGLKVIWPWRTGSRTDLPEGSRVFLLKQGRPPRGIIASGWSITEPPGEPSANFEFTMFLDWDKGQILPEKLLKEEFPEFNWHPAGGGVSLAAFEERLEYLWVDELHRHDLKEALGKMGWFRSKIFAWYRRM